MQGAKLLGLETRGTPRVTSTCMQWNGVNSIMSNKPPYLFLFVFVGYEIVRCKRRRLNISKLTLMTFTISQSVKPQKIGRCIRGQGKEILSASRTDTETL